MSRKQKKLLLRIICSAVLFLLGLILPGWFGAGAMILSWIICGWSVAWKAIRNLLHGQLFDENFLMTLATVGAFALQQFSEGAAVMLFYQVGELFQAIAVDRSRRSIAQLMDLRPDSAIVLRDGEELEVDPDEIQVGELILVSPGERISVDGVIRSGNADLDASRITGESMPVSVGPGDAVLSGCVNLSGNLTIEATSEYGQSTVARILDLVENAQEKKAATEQFITRFARWYTPAVVLAAVLLCTLPPLLLHQSFSLWLKRALTFLVVSCPCALVISVPLSFFGGMAAASKANILIKGGVALEELADPGIVVFDKTGTLTTGTFHVAEIQAVGCTENELLLLAAAAEQYSPHPVARAILAASPHAPVGTLLEDRPGFGVTALVDGKTVLAGNLRFLSESDVEVREWADCAGTVVYIAVDGIFRGCIRVEDSLKENVEEAIQALYDRGVKDTVLLSGDRKQSVDTVAKALGIRNVYSGLLPQDKVLKLEELLQTSRVMFVGDGVNDAPVLTLATVGIAMGGIGSDAAVEAADVVLLSDEPRRIATAIDIARSTLRIARENIIIALGVKAVVLILGALGIAGMWLAVFADVGVAVIAILNAMRTLRLHEKHGS